MSQINPFTGAVPLAPTRSVAERVRRSQADSKNLPQDEAAEHVVENADAVVMISDEHSQQQPKKHQEPEKEKKDSEGAPDDPPRLDITA